jgi:hypothetical protein
MMKRPIFVFTLLFSALCLIAWMGKDSPGKRGIACVEPAAPQIIPLEEQLFGHISDQAVRSSALQFYTFFTQVEMNAIGDLHAARSIYGLPNFAETSGSIYAPPTISNFSVGSNLGFHQGSWGTVPGSKFPDQNTIAQITQRSSANFGH